MRIPISVLPRIVLSLPLAAGLGALSASACRATAGDKTPSATTIASEQETAALTPSAPIALYNGRDLQGWHADVPDKDKDPATPDSFIIRDGNLVSKGDPRGHLITDKRFRDYRLEVEYRFAGEPGNCGVLIHASTPRALYKMFPQSIEVQGQHGDAGDFWVIREDIKVADMQTRRPREEGQQWGHTEADARRILNLTDDSEKPLGQWNHMAIEARGDTIKVWVNGDLVNEGFDATVQEGQIAIQAEGAEVEFRHIELLPLP